VRRLMVISLGIAVIALIGVAIVRHHQTMSPGATARALRQRLHVAYAFDCHRVHNDGTLNSQT